MKKMIVAALLLSVTPAMADRTWNGTFSIDPVKQPDWCSLYHETQGTMNILMDGVRGIYGQKTVEEKQALITEWQRLGTFMKEYAVKCHTPR